jgi:NADPH:quinone reductase-like Zn-dependent oxidoreductase
MLMKAIVCTEYGTPDVLELKEIAKPTPGAGEVLVKIRAASINYGDKALVKGKPWTVRLMGYGLLKPKYKVLGTDIAGQVEAVGSNVKISQPGDEVFGDISEYGFGAFAEYISVPEEALTLKPANLTFEQAAAVPQAAVVALQGLRDHGQIRSGQKVLINGASGGVGTFAVQIAKAFGAEVTGVCSARNLDLVRSIGAEHVIDYTREDFTQNEARYNLIFDIVANHSISDYLRALNPDGHYVACAFNPSSLFLGPLISRKDGKKVSSLVHKPAVEDLIFMRELLEAGQVAPVIDRCYPLDLVPTAMHYLDEGQHLGKVVITVQTNDKSQSAGDT